MMPLWSFQGARARAHSKKAGPRTGLSKLNSARVIASDGGVEVDMLLGEPRHWTDESIDRLDASGVKSSGFPRKEVIQPQLPLRLPCYDFTPIIDPTFGGSLLTVRTPTSGIANFRGVTGGVYKARERIHRDVADSRLLATPPSWRRVSASNPNRDRLFGIRSPSRVCSPLYRPM
jgi:hypothetical protein